MDTASILVCPCVFWSIGVVSEHVRDDTGQIFGVSMLPRLNFFFIADTIFVKAWMMTINKNDPSINTQASWFLSSNLSNI